MNLFEVKCFICKNSDEVITLEEDDLVDLPLHMTYVHASEGLEIEALCDTCDFMFDASKGKFNAHMNSDLQAGIWFGSVAPSPIITLPQSPMA